AVLYNAWVLEAVLPTGLDPRHSYVSELYAADQPFHLLFGGVEILTALLVATGILAWPPGARLPGDRTATAGRWALGVFALASVADVIVPMRCAPSVNHACEMVNPWHTATSALVHAGLFVSMGLLVAAAVARGGRTRWPPLRRRGPWVLAAALLTALATVGPLFGRPGWHGLPQRAHLVLVGVWLVLLAASLRAEHRTARE
ncbi:DUF998 domain-containing protein, partial [Streptomyces stramineus]